MNKKLPDNVPDDFATAFVCALTEMPKIGKDKTADMGSYEYKYADLGTILDAVRPILWANGLTVAQSTVNVDGKVGVETRIYHVSGHVEVFGPLTLPAGNTAQGYGSAITYARRYALTAALGIAPDEDDDGAQAVKAEQAPRRLDSEVDPADWLADAVKMFKEWTDDEKRDAYKSAVKMLAVTTPLSMPDAKLVHENMYGAYLTAHPPVDGSAPF